MEPGPVQRLLNAKHLNLDSPVLFPARSSLIVCNRIRLAKPDDVDANQRNVLLDEVALDAFGSPLAEAVVEVLAACGIGESSQFDTVRTLALNSAGDAIQRGFGLIRKFRAVETERDGLSVRHLVILQPCQRNTPNPAESILGFAVCSHGFAVRCRGGLLGGAGLRIGGAGLAIGRRGGLARRSGVADSGLGPAVYRVDPFAEFSVSLYQRRDLGVNSLAGFADVPSCRAS